MPTGGGYWGVNTITGITRSVFALVLAELRLAFDLSLEQPVPLLAAASAATTSIVSVPTSIVTFGLAFRLWYQSGLVGAPALEANMT